MYATARQADGCRYGLLGHRRIKSFGNDKKKSKKAWRHHCKIPEKWHLHPRPTPTHRRQMPDETFPNHHKLPSKRLLIRFSSACSK